jgi:XTP/dITP diphosphohydrolase
MKTIAFVTTNKSKIDEVNEVLKEYGFVAVQQEGEKKEDKDANMQSIAKDAAKELSQELNIPVIVEDTGLFFSAYNNFPGAQSKFVFNGIGYEGILRLLEGKDRAAYFETVIAYCEPNKEPVSFDGKMEGTISEKVSNPQEAYMPYDSLFVPNGEEKPICQMTIQKKSSLSQRSVATKKLGEFLKNNN